MTNVTITWDYEGSDPDSFSYRLSNTAGNRTLVTLFGTIRAANFNLQNGKYHFEMLSTKAGIDSAHASLDFTV